MSSKQILILYRFHDILFLRQEKNLNTPKNMKSAKEVYLYYVQ